MKIIVKSVPESLNKYAGRKNAWDYRDEKKKWTALVMAACLQSEDASTTPYDYAMVRIDYFFDSARRHDPDNYSGKVIMDGLTRAGVIADDDFGHISLSLHGHVDRENPRTEICVIRGFAP
ncbi:MAG: hypothetical protein RSD27_09640 [Ruthenibacterium sp.]